MSLSFSLFHWKSPLHSFSPSLLSVFLFVTYSLKLNFNLFFTFSFGLFYVNILDAWPSIYFKLWGYCSLSTNTFFLLPKQMDTRSISSTLSPPHPRPRHFPQYNIYILYRYLLLYFSRFTQSFNYFSTILLCFSSLRLFIIFFFSLPSLPSFLSSFILISYFSLSLIVYLYMILFQALPFPFFWTLLSVIFLQTLHYSRII